MATTTAELAAALGVSGGDVDVLLGRLGRAHRSGGSSSRPESWTPFESSTSSGVGAPSRVTLLPCLKRVVAQDYRFNHRRSLLPAHDPGRRVGIGAVLLGRH
jgi:hypothetical protein